MLYAPCPCSFEEYAILPDDSYKTNDSLNMLLLSWIICPDKWPDREVVNSISSMFQNFFIGFEPIVLPTPINIKSMFVIAYKLIWHYYRATYIATHHRYIWFLYPMVVFFNQSSSRVIGFLLSFDIKNDKAYFIETGHSKKNINFT